MRILTLNIIVGLIFSTLTGFSQNIYREGLIVKEAGDTIRGYIKIQGNRNTPEGILFKESDKSIITFFDIENVQSIIIHDYRYYKVIDFNDTLILAQYLVQGKANLFSWDNNFFLQKEDKLYPLTIEETLVNREKSGKISSGDNYLHRKKTFIGTLKSVLNDCSGLQPSIDRSSLSEPSMTNIIENYNDCVNVKPFVYKKRIPLFRLEISPLIGISYTDLNISASSPFEYLNQVDFSQVTLSPGIGFTISNPRIVERTSLYIEARYLRNSFHDRVTYPYATYDDNEVSLSYSYLYLPIMIQTEFPLGIRKAAYLKLGLLETINLTNEYSNTKRQSNYPSVPEIVDKDPFEFWPALTGFTGGLGYKLKVTNKFDFFTEVRFENQGNLVNSSSVGMVQNVYSIITGISF
jgi:hypothetical protein